MAPPIELSTPNQDKYHFFPNTTGLIRFRVKASNDAFIALASCPAVTNPIYEFNIGGWSNTKTAIRKNRWRHVAEVSTPGILKRDEYREFWVCWHDKEISIGHGREQKAFLSYTDTDSVPFNYFGVCTAWGSTGEWIIEQDCNGTTDDSSWVSAKNGEVPPFAIPGGEQNGEPMYIARANFQGGLIPGKLISSFKTAYVSWGGKENPVSEYQVLCYLKGAWERCYGGNIPSNAFPGGQTKDGERLYIGRVIHKCSLTVGKVQASHGFCYIPFDGQEVGFADYEILVS